MITSNGQLTVPPGFRFHPTDEELLYYYLRKKVAYQPIDLDVIRDIDLNKLEPWDLKDRCRIGSSPQNEWYFFSHKDKKYPTGTRTNRATSAGFWKATGRDKAIRFSDSRRIGMRKTLVFYTGRAPHGNKTDWIMHEYRLDDDSMEVQDDGWVVCRVFKKKNHKGGSTPPALVEEDHHQLNQFNAIGSAPWDQKQSFNLPLDYATFDNTMHLPQLLSSESSALPFMPTMSMNALLDQECTQNLMKLIPAGSEGLLPPERFQGSDWSALDKLLACSHQNMDQLIKPSQLLDIGSSAQRFPLQNLGCEADHCLRFSK